MTAYPVSDRLPRRVADGLYWLGGCSDSGAWPTRRGVVTTHEHLSVHLVVGRDATLLVDTGHVAQWGAIRAQLEWCLADAGGRTLDYVFPTHHELPHAGNLGRLLTLHPDAVAVGDTREYGLYFPEIDPARLRRTRPGDEIDLGGTAFAFLPPIWFDLPGTLWGYDTARRTLFPADGLGYVHEHTPDVCGLLPDELPADADRNGVRRFALPFVGMRHHDTAPGVAAYRKLLARHPVERVCSAHGVPLEGAHLAEVTEQALEVVEENQLAIGGPAVTPYADLKGGSAL